jgi:thiol-disulfide isomerase/thioredoxin
MKKLLLIMLAAGAFASCGTKPEATLDGTVAGVADGTKIYLLDGRAKADSTTVKGGKFRFEFADAYPDQKALQLEGGDMFPFFVEPGAITVTIDTASDTPAVFTGTPTNDGKKVVDEEIAVFSRQMREMGPQLATMEDDGKVGTPEFEALLAKYYDISDQIGQHITNTVLEASGTILAAYFAGSKAHALDTPEKVDSVLTIIAGAPANAFTDKLVERRDALAKTAVGAPAPDFTQNQPDGTPLSLSSLKGKFVLIDFWASWCGPCRAENPNVVKLYAAYKNKGFEILGVSLDDDREAWLKAIEDDGLTWLQVSDLGGWNNAVAKEWAVRSIPHTVLVGADGVIIAKNLRGAELEAKIAEVLNTAE